MTRGERRPPSFALPLAYRRAQNKTKREAVNAALWGAAHMPSGRVPQQPPQPPHHLVKAGPVALLLRPAVPAGRV